MKVSLIGVLFALVALFAAVLSPWAIRALSPPTPSVEETIVDFSSRLKEAAKAKLENREYIAKKKTLVSVAAGYYMPAVLVLGLIGFSFGVFGWLKEQVKSPGILAMSLGAGAVLAQWYIFIAMLALCMWFLITIMDRLDIDLG